MAEKNNSKTDSLDLSSVNKSSKSKKTNKTLTQNLFKKQSGPNRDEEGKFAAKSTIGGDGGLANMKRINWTRFFPLVILVALAGGALVYISSAATNAGNAVYSWYSACGYKPMPNTWTNSGYKYWVNMLNKDPFNQDKTYASFKAASAANGIKKCPTNNPAKIAVPEDKKPKITNYTNIVLLDYLSPSIAKTGDSQKRANWAVDIASKKSVTSADYNKVGGYVNDIRANINITNGYKTSAQDKYNKAISNELSRNQGQPILNLIKEIQKEIEAQNGHFSKAQYAYKSMESKLKGVVTTDPKVAAFQTPKSSCKSGYHAQKGSVNISWKVPGTNDVKSGSINAVTCNKNKKGTTPVWDVTKASRVCTGEYIARRVNKTLTGTGYKNAPPAGWVCFRGADLW
ncbi:hypothetical protein H6801_01000 [Candidatus Nomurabacteria bacterium]|nr:hypothetical protein [Candidatus Nomurabacteria bacterium]